MDISLLSPVSQPGPSNEYSGTIGLKMKKKKKGSDPEMEPTGSAPERWDKVGLSCKNVFNYLNYCSSG